MRFILAEEATLIEGDREEWEGWTGMAFPGDGDHVVTGGLVPVRFADGRGVYREPCVWVEHRSARHVRRHVTCV